MGPSFRWDDIEFELVAVVQLDPSTLGLPAACHLQTGTPR
jgi:hypothetical protein